MIKTKLIRKKCGTQHVAGGNRYTGGIQSTDYAAEAGHAREADQARNAEAAVRSQYSEKSGHADSAADIDASSSIWDKLKGLFISKTDGDTASGLITFLKGLVSKAKAVFMDDVKMDKNLDVKWNLSVGSDGNYGIDKDGLAKLAGVVADYMQSSDFVRSNGFDGHGFGITKGSDGKYTFEVDNIIARIKMVAAQLEVHEMSFIGGTVVLSPCGNRMLFVESLDADGSIITDTTKPDRYRCYFLATDGEQSVSNKWTVGQLARCQTSNITAAGKYTDFANRNYWRLVVDVSSSPVVKDGKTCHWIDLSNSDSKSIVLTDASGTTHVVTIGGVSANMSSVPQANDCIVGMGHQWDTDRQDVAIIGAGGWILYKGIDHYDLPKANIVNKFGIDEVIITSDHYSLRPYAQPDDAQTALCYRGPYDDTKYYGHNDITSLDGQTWIASGVKTGDKIKGQKPSAGSAYWSIWVAKGEDGTQGEQGKKGSDATGYSLVHMNDTTGTVKATGSGSATVFRLHYNLHYKAVKMVGSSKSNVNIATIAATIENTTKSTTVNGLEGTLSGDGSTSYTSDERPSSAIPVTVTLSDGTVLYDSVPVTMEAGVAVDIDNKLNKLTTTVAGKADISTINQKADEISMSIASRKEYRNLLKGSDFSYIADNVQLNHSNGQTVEVSDTERYDTSRSVHIKVAKEGDYNGVFIRPVIVKTSTKHYVSVLAKGTGTLVIEIISIDSNGTRKGGLQVTSFPLSSEWTLCRVPFTTGGYDRIEVNFWMYVVGEAYIARPMLEEGSEYTGWTLSPDDPTTEDRLRDAGIDIRKGTIDLRAGSVNFLGADGKPYITAELDDDGMPHLIFYNKAGTAMYDLGYTGLFNLIQDSDKQTWVEYGGQVIDGDTANCSDITGGSYKFVDDDFTEAVILDRTIYEYHPAYVMSNGEKKYYNSNCKNQLYLSNDVDESEGSYNKPTGKALYTDDGILRLNGYLYELVERKVVSKKTNGGTTTIEEHFRFRAHAIYRNRLNLSGGMTDYSAGRTVKIEKFGTAISGSVETKYKVSIDGSDYEDKDIVKL